MRLLLPLALLLPAGGTAPYDVEKVRTLSSEFSDLNLFSVHGSGIEGRGLFTKRPLKAGTRAGLHWIETAVSVGQSRRRTPNFYPAECQFQQQLRPAMSSRELLACFARATNHACDPNFVLDVESMPASRPPAGLRLVPRRVNATLTAFYFKATRDLPTGAEVTFNYLSAPNYIAKPPAAVQGCVLDPRLTAWRAEYDRLEARARQQKATGKGAAVHHVAGRRQGGAGTAGGVGTVVERPGQADLSVVLQRAGRRRH